MAELEPLPYDSVACALDLEILFVFLNSVFTREYHFEITSTAIFFTKFDNDKLLFNIEIGSFIDVFHTPDLTLHIV